MSKLLLRSKQRLASAKRDLNFINDDPSNIDGACFQIQQSMDFAMKYLLEINGIDYGRTHNICNLLSLIIDNGLYDSSLTPFNLNAEKYTNWETLSRYDDNFTASVKDVTDAVNYTSSLIKFVESTVSQSTIPEDAITWCRNNAPEALKNLNDFELWESMQDIYYKYGAS